MTSHVPTIITGSSVGEVWARALLEMLDRKGAERAVPLVLSIKVTSGPAPCEKEIRAAADHAISVINASETRSSIETVEGTASTLFPRALWAPTNPRPRKEVFAHYSRSLPRIKARSSRNRYGTYFQRMIDYRGCNQLGDLLDLWDARSTSGARPRTSALQLSCYDPTRDSRRAVRLGFPCLHQVGFGYSNQELSVSAYYPTEYVFARGYGNYLGLTRLGEFVAHETGLALSAVHCFVAHPILSISKRALGPLASQLRGILCGTPLKPI